MHAWNVLIQDNHEGYIGWEEFEENRRRMLTENAYSAAASIPEGCTRRTSTADWPCSLRTMRANHACVLWHEGRAMHTATNAAATMHTLARANV